MRLIRRRQVDRVLLHSRHLDWPNLLASSACPPACPGAFIKSTDFRHPSFGSDTIDPDLKPMLLQEATAGIDHELNSQLAVGVHYVHKQIDTAIEDTGHAMRRATRYISSRIRAKVSRPRVSALIVGLCLLLGTPARAATRSYHREHRACPRPLHARVGQHSTNERLRDEELDALRESLRQLESSGFLKVIPITAQKIEASDPRVGARPQKGSTVRAVRGTGRSIARSR